MTERKAIERLQRIRQFYLDTIKDDIAVEAVDIAIKAVKKQEADRWIPCNEKLPDKSDYYLITQIIKWNGQKYKEVCQAHYEVDAPIYHISFWEGSESHKLGKVIAWRPLPEPYIEEKE